MANWRTQTQQSNQGDTERAGLKWWWSLVVAKEKETTATVRSDKTGVKKDNARHGVPPINYKIHTME